jgi:hypothetical protein
MKHSAFKYLLLSAAILVMVSKMSGQSAMPDELTKNSIKEQINYIEEHTRIYENFRAIREDMFQKVNGNIKDSLAADRKRIAGLDNLISALRNKSDSLMTAFDETNKSLAEVTATKNHIKVLGMQVNKTAYNSVMFTIVAGLVFILAVGFLIFKRNLFTNISTKKELKDLRDEFEAYRQSARIAREKMAMDHFNEIKKLKGNK